MNDHAFRTVGRPEPAPSPNGRAAGMPAAMRRRKSDWPGLLIVVFVAFIVRLATINTQSAWLDEGYSLGVARHSLSDLISFTVHYDTHPPLYYVLLHFWSSLFGFGVIQGRFLSLLCGVASAAALFAVARALFDRATGYTAAILLALSPIAVWYSNQIRMFEMAGLFALLALACQLTATLRHRARYWLPYVGFATLAVYTDYSAGYIIIGAALAAFLLLRTDRAMTRLWVLSHAVLIGLLLPALALLAYQTRNGASIAFIPSPNAQIVGATLLDLVSLHSPAAVLALCLAVGAALLCLLAISRDLRRPSLRPRYVFLACIILAPLAIPLVLSILHPIFLTRTVMMALYGLLIVVARGLLRLTRQVLPLGLVALAGLLLGSGAALHQAYATTINDDWRGAAGYVHTQAAPGDVLIFDPGYSQLPFDLYWSPPASRNPSRGYPYDESLLTNNPRLLRTDQDMAQAVHGAQTVWLIVGAGGADPQHVPLTWLRSHLALAGQQSYQGVSIYRFTTLHVAGSPNATAWLNAAGTVLPQTRSGDLVVVHGPGADVFVQAWNTRPHAAAHLLRIDTGGQAALTAATRQPPATIRLISAPVGRVDPAGIANNWLYHHGPQIGTRKVYDNQVFTYTFAYGWGKK
ncbi:MAG: hypothetical protein JWO42_1667 [Chloroflexi bacterium]|nr:hypothetical protein [Chloroflexota bacterium]